MNHRVSSIKNIRTLKALRGESVRIDLGKTFDGTLRAWMKRDPNSPTHREFTIEDNRFLILTNDQTKDFYTSANVLIETIAGEWYFDVEQEREDKPTRTIFTGRIFFENDITGSNSVILGGENDENTVEFSKSIDQPDPNNSTQADDFILKHPNKQLFWQVDIPATETNEAINEQYWYSYKIQQWINLSAARTVNLSFEEELLNYTYFNQPVFGIFLQIPNIDELGSTNILHNLQVDKYLKSELVLSNQTNNDSGEGNRIQLFGSQLNRNSIQVQNFDGFNIDLTQDFIYIEYTKNNSPMIETIFNNQFNNIFS